MSDNILVDTDAIVDTLCDRVLRIECLPFNWPFCVELKILIINLGKNHHKFFPYLVCDSNEATVCGSCDNCPEHEACCGRQNPMNENMTICSCLAMQGLFAPVPRCPSKYIYINSNSDENLISSGHLSQTCCSFALSWRLRFRNKTVVKWTNKIVQPMPLFQLHRALIDKFILSKVRFNWLFSNELKVCKLVKCIKWTAHSMGTIAPFTILLEPMGHFL